MPRSVLQTTLRVPTVACVAEVAWQGGVVATPRQPALLEATTSVLGGGRQRHAAPSSRHPWLGGLRGVATAAAGLAVGAGLAAFVRAAKRDN